jgi:polyribonucleotide nucleotidyltransferase
VVKEGDQVKVKVLGFDDRGKVKLSMRVVDQATGADITEQVGAKPGRGDREKTDRDGEGRRDDGRRERRGDREREPRPERSDAAE